MILCDFLYFLWSSVDKLANVVLALVTTAAFIVAVIEYRRQKRNSQEQNRPYVIVDLERVVSGLFDISVRNIGRSVAKNIKVKFKPNIKPYGSSDIKINDLKFLQNLKFLPPDKDLRFFFGSVMGESVIKREFHITVTYQDVAEVRYEESFIIDPRDYLDLHSISRYDMHDAVKKLEEIGKALKDSAKAHGDIGNTLGREGLRIRNLHSSSMNAKAMLELIIRIYEKEGDYELTIRPYVHDMKLLITQARDLLVASSNLAAEETVQELDWLIENTWHYKPEEANKHFEALKKAIKGIQ